MMIAVHLARHRRLAAWVGLSLLLHLSAFALFDAVTAPSVPAAAGAPLALRLASGRAPAPRAASAPAPALESAARPAAEPADIMPAPLARRAPAAPLALEPAAAAPAPQPPGAAGSAPLQMPGRYRVRLPPPARLRYVLTHSAPGQPATTDSAQLAWERSGGAWRLHIDGVLGTLASEGGEDDAGIAPHGLGGDAAAGAQPYPGSQDRASSLLQLAGMGLADPDQMQGTIELVVASPGGARIERWQVVGTEELPTAAGWLGTVRLAQPAQAGEALVEVWLAPAHHWLPVQLRVTQPDGAVANQVVSSIDSEALPALR